MYKLAKHLQDKIYGSLAHPRMVRGPRRISSAVSVQLVECLNQANSLYQSSDAAMRDCPMSWWKIQSGRRLCLWSTSWPHRDVPGTPSASQPGSEHLQTKHLHRQNTAGWSRIPSRDLSEQHLLGWAGEQMASMTSPGQQDPWMHHYCWHLHWRYRCDRHWQLSWMCASSLLSAPSELLVCPY